MTICFNIVSPQINLYGGSNSRISGGHLFFVTRYVLHPSYSRVTLDFDIAIIEVDVSLFCCIFMPEINNFFVKQPGTPLDGFVNVRPIPLPASCATACCGVCPEGNQISVAGWGRIDDGSLPEFLRKVSKDIVSNAVCSTFWNNISNRMFCTHIENGRDSCNGDSGSAIVRDGVQVGVVSFGSSVCGDGSRPAVYVRVEQPQIRSWIDGFVSV